MQPGFKKTLAFSALLLLAACSGNERYAQGYGQPESLLDHSAERVSFGIATPSFESDLTNWVNNDQPSRAELQCSGFSQACDRAEDVLKQFGVPYTMTANPSTGDAVVLYYERFVARDCDSRFVDRYVNPNNHHHVTYGCSVAANMLQQVSDQRAFVAPAVMDPQDAEQAVKALRKANRR